MKVYITVFLIFFGLAPIIAQNLNKHVECGDRIESSFTEAREYQSFTISLEGGDNLKVNSHAKYGDFLKYNIDIYGPSGNHMVRDLDYKSRHQVETGIVPGTNIYGITPFNYVHNLSSHRGTLGDYVIEFVCIKSDGTIISPDNKVSTKSSSSGSEANTPPTTPRTNESSTQFLSVPTGIPMEGEIQPGSGQLFGFKTKIDANEELTFNFQITKGDTALDIQIVDAADQSVVFFTALGHARSIESSIKFPKTGEYIISIREGKGKAGTTPTLFNVILN